MGLEALGHPHTSDLEMAPHLEPMLLLVVMAELLQQIAALVARLEVTHSLTTVPAVAHQRRMRAAQ